MIQMKKFKISGFILVVCTLFLVACNGNNFTAEQQSIVDELDAIEREDYVAFMNWMMVEQDRVREHFIVTDVESIIFLDT